MVHHVVSRSFVKLVLNVERRADGAARITGIGRNKNIVKQPAFQDLAIHHAVEHHAAGQAEILLPRPNSERLEIGHDRLFEDHLHARGNVFMLRLNSGFRHARRTESV